MWEREQLAMIRYLHQSEDPWLQAVLNHLAAESEGRATT